ncbi:membrane dipeptidase [Rhodoligotrophos appendicifer]|uniref:dipeptidase n=1 Tax=Rhodoligotrophos appendicifer TaxID=987056 RepID=UPI0011850943
MGSSALLPAAQIPPPARDGKTWLDRALDAGITALNVTMGIKGVAQGADDFRAYLHSVHGYLSYFELEPRLLHVQSAADIARAKAEGRLGIVFGCQGLDTKLNGDPALILIMARLGQRIMQLMYNERSSLGSGCLEVVDDGLTEFGRICIREINDCGMVVDMSHAGQKTARDAIELTRGIPIISHANVRSLCDHPRNATNDLLTALADRGGVIGITAFAPFCENERGRPPTIDDMIDHIVYVAERFGIEHVGIGSDMFEGESYVRFERFFRRRYPEIVGQYQIDTVYAEGFGVVDDFAGMPSALARRGFSPCEIRKVLGGNFLRVFETVWG